MKFRFAHPHPLDTAFVALRERYSVSTGMVAWFGFPDQAKWQAATKTAKRKLCTSGEKKQLLHQTRHLLYIHVRGVLTLRNLVRVAYPDSRRTAPSETGSRHNSTTSTTTSTTLSKSALHIPVAPCESGNDGTGTSSNALHRDNNNLRFDDFSEDSDMDVTHVSFVPLNDTVVAQSLVSSSSSPSSVAASSPSSSSSSSPPPANHPSLGTSKSRSPLCFDDPCLDETTTSSDEDEDDDHFVGHKFMPRTRTTTGRRVVWMGRNAVSRRSPTYMSWHVLSVVILFVTLLLVWDGLHAYITTMPEVIDVTGEFWGTGWKLHPESWPPMWLSTEHKKPREETPLPIKSGQRMELNLKAAGISPLSVFS